MANKLEKGDTHPPHTHSNNIFSAYYLEGNSEIQFLTQDHMQVFYNQTQQKIILTTLVC